MRDQIGERSKEQLILPQIGDAVAPVTLFPQVLDAVFWAFTTRLHVAFPLFPIPSNKPDSCALKTSRTDQTTLIDPKFGRLGRTII